MSLKIKKILVPTDFSEISINAIDYAAFIAKNCDAEVILLHVYESIEQNSGIKLALDINEIIEKGINEKIADIKSTNKNLWGVKFSSKVINGKIHSEIHHAAKDLNADLIVMGTHGSSGIGSISKFLLGSNAYRVTNDAPCPVLTLREKNDNIRFKDILLPIDHTEETRQKLETAIEWAKAFNATIHLVALTAFFDELFVEIKDLKKLVSQIEEKLEKAGVRYTSKMIRHQRISESVLSYADKIHTDLIFIVTGAESKLSEIVLRSAVRTIVSESKSPVLSISSGK